MLLHTTDEMFKSPLLELYHVKHPIPTIGMDRQPTEVDRIIVMLGPEKMDELTTEFLGTISSSIIEKEEYTKIYQFGNTQEIKKLLEGLGLEVLQKILK